MGRRGGRERSARAHPIWLVAAFTLVACGDTRLVQIEPPADEVLYEEGPSVVAVSGRARLFPPVLVWLKGQGRAAPALDARRVIVEDPLQQALGDVPPLHAEALVEPSGAFTIPEVEVESVVFGLTGMLGDEPGLAPVTSLLYDAAQAGTRPREDVEGVWVEAVPREWLRALEAGLGRERLAALAPEAGGLLEAGLLLGRVLDPDGGPVEAARLRVHPPELQDRLVYPHADVEDVGVHATDASGLFLLVHDGGDVRTLTLTLEDAPGALPHHGVLAPGRALLLQLHPPP